MPVVNGKLTRPDLAEQVGASCSIELVGPDGLSVRGFKSSTNIAPYVRTGAVVGSGSDVIVAALENAIRNVGTDDRRYGSSLMLEGLTPGNSYNVRLEHRVSGGIGSIQYRHVAVFPLS